MSDGDYEDVTKYGLNQSNEAELLAKQIECTFIWSNSQGHPLGVIMNYVFRDGRIWLTASSQRAWLSASSQLANALPSFAPLPGTFTSSPRLTESIRKTCPLRLPDATYSLSLNLKTSGLVPAPLP